VYCGCVRSAVLKPEQRQAKRQKIEENRLKKQQLASVTGSLSSQMTDEEHELTRIITDAFVHHLNLPDSSTSQVDSAAALSIVTSEKYWSMLFLGSFKLFCLKIDSYTCYREHLYQF